jgi:uncharacterized integral membrane protein
MKRVLRMLRGPDLAKLMRQIPIIAYNAFMELVRQPVFLLLFTLAPILCVFLALPSYFGFGGTATGPMNYDLEMAKDGALTVAFLAGLAAAVLCATSSISREIETGTALAVLSKPVGRIHFLVGKYLGIIGALTLGSYLNFIGVLLASRMAHDAYTDYDIVGTLTLLLFIFLAYLAGGLVNYFLQKPFVPNTVFYLVVAMTVGFLVICAQDKTTAYYWYETFSGGISQAGIEANFSEIWKWSPTGGTYPGAEERLPKLAEDKNYWQDVDFGMIQLVLLLIFALWILAAVAVACSTRLSWMPTMLICTGVFLVGMMSDYVLGKAAEGGGLIRPGEYVEYRPPGAKLGLHNAFELEPRGIRRISNLQYRVRVNFSATKFEGELFEDNIITVDAGTEPMMKIDYDYLHDLLIEDLKEHWNRPLNRALITVGRELMPAAFPPGDWETAAFLTSDEFQQRKLEKMAAWRAKAGREGRDFSELEPELTRNLVAAIRLEKEQELVDEMMLAMDDNTGKLELGELGMAEGLSKEARDLRKKLQKERYKQFQYLRTQAQMETLPGQLAFWIRPQTGKVSKWDDGKGIIRPVSEGSRVAKILYVLLPNWQLFWLSDAVSPEEDELKVFRQEMKYQKGQVPWRYVFTSFIYVVLYVCLTLSVALWLFENRELN